MQTRFNYLRKNFRLFFVMILVMTVIQSGVAQNQPGVWDLKSCIEYAKKNNISLKNLRLTISSNEQSLLLSKSARYPDLNASVGQGLSYNAEDRAYTSSSYGINTSMVVYNGNYINNDIKSNKLSLQASNLDVEAAENDIILQITQAYLNILLAEENIEYVKDLVVTSESQVAQCKEKYNSGSVALKDLMQLQSALANDKYSLVLAENAKRQNLLSLKRILQLPIDTVFDIASPENVSTEISIFPMEDVQKSALQSMPEVKSSELKVTRQNVELLKAKSRYLPSLYLSGGVTTGFGAWFSKPTDSYFSQLGANISPQLGLSLTIPIFNGNTTRVNVAKAKIILEQTKLESENTKTELMQTVEQAYINILNARSQFDAADEQLNYAKESYRISSEQLKLGANNNVEYLQQKNLYVQALQMYVQAKYSMLLFVKIYNFYKGIPVTE